MSRVTLLLVALCLLFVLALGSTPQSSQQLNVPHELHEHEVRRDNDDDRIEQRIECIYGMIEASVLKTDVLTLHFFCASLFLVD